MIREYTPHFGPIVKIMPQLVAQGQAPLSVAGFMQFKLNATIPTNVKEFWWTNYLDTGDLAVFEGGGAVTLVPDAVQLRNIQVQDLLGGGLDGALWFEDEICKKLEGIRLSREQQEKWTGRDLSAAEVKECPFWRALAREESYLLNHYTDEAFRRGQEKGYQAMMNIYLPARQGRGIARPWRIGIIDPRRSHAGTSYLDYRGAEEERGGGRLMGLRERAA